MTSGGVTGITEWKRTLHKIEMEKRQGAKTAVKEALDAHVSVSGVLTPVGTRKYRKKGEGVHPGYLKRRNRTRWVERGPTRYIGEYYNDAPYAIFVAFGTYKMRARDFVTPGFYAGRKKLFEWFGRI